jgi:hypothetical protein
MKTCGCGAVFSGGTMEQVEKAYADHQETVHGIEADALIPRVKQLEQLVRDKNTEIAELKAEIAELKK